MSPSKAINKQSFDGLNREILKCTKCPRLIKHCKQVAKEKRKSFASWEYWGKPVPNFGSYPSKLLIVGLAPAAHGANRTGRIFTGDNSGLWLYRAMYRAGFANQERSESLNDGLQPIDASITCVAHCAPPENKLTPSEALNCSEFLKSTIQLSKAKVIIALGKIAWDSVLKEVIGADQATKKPKFSHGQIVKLKNCVLIASYHPSQQNTFTKRLTENMLDDVFLKAKTISIE